MSSKSDYAAQEWQLLLDVPPLVGAAVMVAGRSGLGTMKEAFAVVSGVMAAREEYMGNELIQSLIQGRLKDKDRSSVERRAEELRGKSSEELVQLAVGKCQEVVELLQAKSTEQETNEYKQWTISVGEKVANAAKEGGFLGIGGERVSEAERVVIQEVSDALGMT